MAQDDPSDIQAEFLAEPGRGVVAELIRVPVRNVGLVTRLADGVPVAPCVVVIAEYPLRVPLPSIQLGGLNASLPIPSPFGPVLGYRLPGLEEIGSPFGPEPGSENLLGSRTKVDPTLAVVMLVSYATPAVKTQTFFLMCPRRLSA